MRTLMPRAAAAAAGAALTLTLTLTGCGGTTAPTATPSTSAAAPSTSAAAPSTSTAAPSTMAAAPTSAPAPQITKVLTFVVENHSLDEMRASMPFVYALATQYAYADNYTAITHPSLPNYLAIASGSTQGVTDDRDPAFHRLEATTVFDQAIARHKTAKIYADSMTADCQVTSSGLYAVRHNPWTYFVHSASSCGRYDVPISDLPADVRAGALPDLAMVVPDLVHDAHDAQLSTADAWLEQQIRLIEAGPDWRAGRLAIVVTADEDDRASGNKVLTVVASRYQSHRVVHTALNHYSLTRFLDSVIGAPYLANAATATSMRAAFGIATPYGTD